MYRNDCNHATAVCCMLSRDGIAAAASGSSSVVDWSADRIANAKCAGRDGDGWWKSWGKRVNNICDNDKTSS